MLLNVVQRVGRIKADGSRTEARELRRLTVYLEPETAKAVDIRAAEDGVNRSELGEKTLEELVRENSAVSKEAACAPLRWEEITK